MATISRSVLDAKQALEMTILVNRFLIATSHGIFVKKMSILVFLNNSFLVDQLSFCSSFQLVHVFDKGVNKK